MRSRKFFNRSFLKLGHHTFFKIFISKIFSKKIFLIKTEPFFKFLFQKILKNFHLKYSKFKIFIFILIYGHRFFATVPPTLGLGLGIWLWLRLRLRLRLRLGLRLRLRLRLGLGLGLGLG